MNYYPHHIGDYLRDTAHLTALEDGIYRRMLDLYYASEKPLDLDREWLCRLLRVSSDIERESVAFLLKNYFLQTADGWRNKRADHEIRIAHEKAKVARRNGKRGGRPKTQRVISGLAKHNPDESSQNQNQNQNQIKDKDTVGQKPDAIKVLEFLNFKTGRNYEPCKANLELILARFREGATVDDLKAVVAKKCREWAGDEKMAQYLRPLTLFNRSRFAQYKGELVSVEAV